jgi:hypothetical protein
MAEPLPSTYGPAGWINWTHNWRKEDGDFLQYRGILRYATDADRPASPQTGQAVYVQATDTVSVWSAEWVPLLSSRLMRLATSGTGATGTSTLSHISAGGAGLVFSNTKVRSSLDFVTSAGFQADTVSVFTAAGGGNRTAKLTTSPANLVSDSPILAPSMTLNGAAGADVLTLSAGNLKVVGTASFTSMVTGAASMQATRFFATAAQDSTANATTRKDYVDTLAATKLSLAGGDMTGALGFGARLGQHINLYSTAYGIGIQGGTLYYRTGGQHKFYVGGSHSDTATASPVTIDSGGLDVAGGLTVTGTASVNSYLYSGVAVVAGGNGGQVRMVDTVAGGYNIYLGFYNGGTTTVPGPRAGWLGYSGTTEFRMMNEMSGGILRLLTTGAGDVYLQPGVGGEIFFSPNNTFQGKMYGTNFIWGKAASDVHNVGLEMDGSYGRYMSTTDVASNLYLHHVGGNDASGKAFIQFLAGTTTVLMSEVRQNSGRNGITIVNCTVSAPSDYRWKNDLGPIPHALDRVLQLRPRSLEWKSNGEKFEGFIAHEAGAVTPYLLSGVKDAVNDEGQIEGQGFNYGGMSPLLAAAIQELTERVQVLEAAA